MKRVVMDAQGNVESSRAVSPRESAPVVSSVDAQNALHQQGGRAGLRRLAFLHVGCTLLALPLLVGVNLLVASLIGQALIGPSQKALVALGVTAGLGLGFILASRGPRWTTSEAPGWMRFLLLWRFRRYGYPLSFVALGLLTAVAAYEDWLN